MQVSIHKIPDSLQEFQSLSASLRQSPEGVCALFLCAVRLFDKNKDEGAQDHGYPARTAPHDAL